MTTVVFQRNEGGPHYVSDSQSTADNGTIRRTDKVFRIDGHVIGLAGSESVVNLILLTRFHPLETCRIPDRHLTMCVAGALRSSYKDLFPPAGHIGGPRFNLLIAHEKVDTFYKLNGLFGVEESSDRFLSIGSGAPFARRNYVRNPLADPVDHVKSAALKDPYTSGPFISY